MPDVQLSVISSQASRWGTDPGLPKGKAEVTRGREPGPCSHLVKPQASWRMGPSHLPCLTEDSKILLDYPGSNKIAVFLLAESTVNFK